jgi:hypothetical protein
VPVEADPLSPDDSAFIHSANDGFDALLRAVASAPARTPRTPPWTPGTRVGRYRVVERLAAGGMGVVYRALDEGLGRVVALKTWSSGDDGSIAASIAAEARRAARVTHPNLGAVYDVDDRGPTPYFAMELVEGETLARVLGEVEHGEAALSLSTALSIARQILDGLAALHAGGIVHRDLSPRNVLIDAHGTVKIVDFGISLLTSGREATDEFRHVGTPRYASPEQQRGEPVGPSADVFAFGQVLSELLDSVGRSPRGGDPLRKLARRCLGEPGTRPADGQSTKAALDRAIRTREVRRRATTLALLVAAAVGLAFVVFAGVSPAPAAPSIAETRTDKLGATPLDLERLTFQPTEASPDDVAVSPDGRTLAIVDATGLYRQDRDTGERTRVALALEPENVSWMGSGGERGLLLVAGRDEHGTGEPRSVLLGVDERGSVTPLLARSETIFAHSASPGSDALAIVDRSGLHIFHGVDGARLDELRAGTTLFAGEPVYFTRPAWSPDGRWLAVMTVAPGGRTRLQIVNAASGEVRHMLEDPALGSDLATSALVFTSPATLVVAHAPRVQDPALTTLVEITVTADRLLPRPIGTVPFAVVHGMTFDATTRALVFVGLESQADVYVADLDGGAPLVPRRLTLSDRDEWMSGFGATGDTVWIARRDGSSLLAEEITIRDGEPRRSLRDPGMGISGVVPVPGAGGLLYFGTAPVLESGAGGVLADEIANEIAPAIVLWRQVGDRTALVFEDFGPQRLLRNRPGAPFVRAACAAQSGRCFVADGATTTLIVHEVHEATTAPVLELRTDHPSVHVFAPSPTGQSVAVRGRDAIDVVDLATGERRSLPTRLADSECWPQYIDFEDEDTLIASVACASRPFAIARYRFGSAPEVLWETRNRWPANLYVAPDASCIGLTIIAWDGEVYRTVLPPSAGSPSAGLLN